MEDQPIAQFKAYLPAIQSAIKTGPDGARIQLDIPQTEKEEYMKLQDAFDKVLKITVSEA